MPTTYSPELRFSIIGNGEQSGTWGDTTNTNIGALIEDAITTTKTILVTSAAQALVWANGSPDEARCAGLNLTTSTGAAFALYAPPVAKLYMVKNSSGYTATFYVATAYSGTTAAVGSTNVIIPNGKSVLVRSDGVNMVEQLNHIAGDLSIAGSQTVGGNATVTGNLTVTGTTSFAGSAALQGTPTAPTPAIGTNTTQIATTQFVQSAVGNVTNVLNLTNWAITETFATQTANITIGTPAIVTVPAAPANGTAVAFTTTGSLPSGITANVPYYVFNRSGGSYNLATTLGQAQTATYATATPNVFAVTAAPTNGQVVYFGTGCPSTITAGTNYYVINRTATTFQVSTTSGGSAVTFTASGTCTATWQTIVATSGAQSGVQTETTSKIYFGYKGVNKMSVDLGGNAIMTGNVTAFGTP